MKGGDKIVPGVEAPAEPYVRSMTLADLDQVLAIERVSFPTPWTESAFRHELTRNPRAAYLVCARGADVLGYAGMWIFCGEAHITNLAVHPDHRRRGLGRLLIEILMDRARSARCDTATLEVRESNSGAQNLYLSLGFKAQGRRHGYYTDTREDAIIMTVSSLDPGRGANW